MININEVIQTSMIGGIPDTWMINKETHMIKPLYNDPTRYGRIPDPPERSECCGNCRFNHREGKDIFTCSNEDSEYYASFTSYDDVCPDYEEKEK